MNWKLILELHGERFIAIAGQRFRTCHNANIKFQEAHLAYTASEAISFCLTCTIESQTAEALVDCEAHSAGLPHTRSSRDMQIFVIHACMIAIHD